MITPRDLRWHLGQLVPVAEYYGQALEKAKLAASLPGDMGDPEIVHALKHAQAAEFYLWAIIRGRLSPGGGQ